MVHEYQLYHLDGLYSTQSSVHIPIPTVYHTVYDICLGSLDPRIYWYDSQLSADFKH